MTSLSCHRKWQTRSCCRRLFAYLLLPQEVPTPRKHPFLASVLRRRVHHRQIADDPRQVTTLSNQMMRPSMPGRDSWRNVYEENQMALPNP